MVFVGLAFALLLRNISEFSMRKKGKRVLTRALFFFFAIFTAPFMKTITLKGVKRMDEMNIVSKFTTMMISKIARKVLRKKFGYDVDIQLNEIKTTIADGKTHIHVDLDAELSKEELLKILKNIGLD